MAGRTMSGNTDQLAKASSLADTDNRRDALPPGFENPASGQTGNDIPTLYTYDTGNRQVSVDKGDVNIQTATYNSAGQRISKETTAAGMVHYFYQDGSVRLTTDGEGARITSNLQLPGGAAVASTRFAAEYTGVWYFASKDIRGSVTNIVDDTGSHVTSYRYSDWGETERTGDTAFINEVAYTGAIYDSETGEYYLNARSYDPVTAVFTAQDTYRGETGDPSTLNYYAYCGGDPINATDPSGHDAVWLQDINGVYGFGHTGALFYGGGAWQHFYYGSSATTKVGGKKKKQIIGIKKLKSSFHWRASYIFDPATRELIKTTSALSNLNKAVHSTKNRKSGEVIYKGNYDGHVYFKGNFTRSIAAAKKKYTKKSVKKYDLLAHNCMHATIDMLLKGTFSFKKKASTARKKMRKVLRDTRNNNHVPNYAYTRVSLEYARLKKKYGTK